MGRSGTHAIANWLTYMCEEYVHIDNLRPHEEKNKDCMNINWTQYNPNTCNFIVNLENVPPEIAARELANWPEYKYILLLRNPFNNIASVYHYYISKVGIDEAYKLTYDHIVTWKYLAREFVGDTYYVPAIRCYYDMWFRSSNYRVYMSRILGLDFNDTGANEITNVGRSHIQQEKNPRRLKPFSRFKMFLDDEAFLSFFDNDIYDLWSRIVGENKAPYLRAGLS